MRGRRETVNYQEARAYIDALGAGGIMPGLSRIQALLEYFHHPENDLQVIHVAGTNGKGSVCSFIASALEEAGYRTGRYISPGIFEYRDRIQINGKWISEQDIASLMSEIRTAVSSVNVSGVETPSAFEAETVMAFLYFKEQKCDFVILECGMGGLNDATNVISHPLVSVITPVAFDHMQYLGTTIEEIASQKGGIIKEGRPVVIGAKDPGAEAVLQEICRKMHVVPTVTDFGEIRVRSLSTMTGIVFDYSRFEELRIQMAARYQTENAAIAIDVLSVLKTLPDNDYKLPSYLTPAEMLTDSVIYKGISQVKWPGRFEVVREKPLMIIDGAHNPHGAAAAVDALKALHIKNVTLMMAVFMDKDYEQMLQIFSEVSDTIIAYATASERALDADTLSLHAGKYFRHTITAESQHEAYDKALAETSPNGVILACGSLSTVVSLKKIVTDQKSQEEVHERN